MHPKDNQGNQTGSTKPKTIRPAPGPIFPARGKRTAWVVFRLKSMTCGVRIDVFQDNQVARTLKILVNHITEHCSGLR